MLLLVVLVADVDLVFLCSCFCVPVSVFGGPLNHCTWSFRTAIATGPRTIAATKPTTPSNAR